MAFEDLRIVRPALQYRDPFLDYIASFEEAGKEIEGKAAQVAREDFENFLVILERQARGIDNENGFNREQVYWLLDAEGQMLSDGRLRYPVTPFVENTLGHLGGSIRPGYRNRGIGSYFLDFLLEEARKMGMEYVVFITGKSNIPARKILEKKSGVLISEFVDEKAGEAGCRYRIDLVNQAAA